MYKNQLSQHFTYIYSKRKLPGTHNMYRGDAVLSPPRNHGSILLGNKFIGIYMYFMSNAKIKIFKQRLLNLDFALTQNEKFYFFFLSSVLF